MKIQSRMLSKLARFSLATTLAVAGVSAFAQSDPHLTRAQVRSDLVALEKAGYNPGMNDINYPNNIQAAERRVNGQDASTPTAQ